MIALPDEILKRAPAAGFARVLKDRLVLHAAGAVSLADSYDDAALCVRCVISTDEVDRVGDVVVPAGGVWAGFAKAPAIFFNHQQGLDGKPIAFAWDLSLPPQERVCTVRAEAGRVVAEEYYSRSTPEGAIFYALDKEGLRGKSIGFNPLSEPRRIDAGGFRYDAWDLLEFSNVGVACNAGATTGAFAEKLRDLLDSGKIAGERIGPAVRKSLEPLAARPRGVFSGWTNSAARGHNGPKPFRRALAQAGGPAGGYLVSPRLPAAASDNATQDNTRDAGAQLKERVAAAAAEHFGADATGHVVHLHPETGAVHHSHPVDYDADKLARFKEACEGIDGVTSVHQEADKAVPPDGEGWEHAFGVGGKNAVEDDLTPDETKDAAWWEARHQRYAGARKEGVDKAKKKPKRGGSKEDQFWRLYENGIDEGLAPDEAAARAHGIMEDKGKAGAVAFVKSLSAFALRGFLQVMRDKASEELQACVSRKIPKLLDEGYEQDQAAAIAYSMYGETKALDESGGDDGHTPGGLNPAEDETDETVPHGVDHAMKALAHHKNEMPRMHPNDAKFYKGVMSMIREHAKGEYPEHADKFGEDEENPPETGTEGEEDGQDKTEEALAPYKAWRPLAVKHLRERILKRMKAAHLAACKAATEHLGELAQIQVGQKWMGSHKSATMTHHKAMDALCKELEVAGVEEEGPEPEGDPLAPMKGLDMEALAATLTRGNAEIIKPELYAVTGRRAHKPTGAFTGG